MTPTIRRRLFGAAAIPVLAFALSAVPQASYGADTQAEPEGKLRASLPRDRGAVQSPVTPPPPNDAMVLTAPPPGKIGTEPVQMGKLGIDVPRPAGPERLGTDVPPGGNALNPPPRLAR